MSNTQQEDVRGIMNETSKTIHKHEIGVGDYRTLCGQSYHLDREQLQIIQIKQATERFDAEKCGRCFDNGRGY